MKERKKSTANNCCESSMIYAKMPWCVVVGCNNNTFKKNSNKDVSFFPIPKDGSLKRRWVQNIKRENLPKDPKICH